MGKLPHQIGPYSISRLLGAGGSGAVYLAREPGTGRELALKVLLIARGGSGEQRRRFEREIAALRGLEHPNLVRHVADGVTPDGAPWLAMERVPGETLEARLVRGPLPLGEALPIARQLAAGLAEAHRRGIVHRDVKPANVLWAPDGRIVLTDFGLAKELEVEESRRLSTTGVLMGTPDYWAPEQASGEHARVTCATDVYSLGATLHAVLTGSPPFRSATLLEAVVATRERAPAPPSRSRPGVPAWLDALVLRCLEKEPARRFQDAEALFRALVSGAGRARRSGRIARAWAAGALLAVCAASAVVLGLRDVAPAPDWREPWTRGDPVTAAPLVRRAAEGGELDAMHALGLLLAAGAGVAADHTAAAGWLLRAAERGHPGATYERGLLEWNGLGVARDPASARRRIHAAARAGHARAMWAASVLAAEAGQEAEAEHWLRRSAELGDEEGMFTLGFGLMTGQGVRRDPVEGRRWLERVAAEGGAELSQLGKNALVALADEREAVMTRMAQRLPAGPTPPPRPAQRREGGRE